MHSNHGKKNLQNHCSESRTIYTGWPQKSKPLSNYQKIVLKPVNEITFIRQIKV